MRHKVILLSMPLMFSVVLAETETHSTAGIGNKAPQENLGYPQPLLPDGADPYDDGKFVNEELPPPTTVKQVSPTHSKAITRTTSRPTQLNPQPNGVGIAPVVVPVYPDGRRYPPAPPGFYQVPPSFHR